MEREEAAYPQSQGSLLSISELAYELDITTRTIRFYESKGLLDPQRVGANRAYTHRDRARLKIILRGKRLGFSLAQVQDYLDLYDADPTHKDQLLLLLSNTRRRIHELEQQRKDLELTLDELHEVEEQTLEALHGRGIEPPPRGGDNRSSESSTQNST